MSAELTIDGQTYRFDATEPIDISIPLNFNGPQPNAYGVVQASSEACVAGDLIGDTRRGGSCNFEQYTLIPHCNGTHTECVGHITRERISIRDCLQDVLVSARLITIDPSYAGDTEETYSMSIGAADRLITTQKIRNALASADAAEPYSPDALIIRTLPNDDRKLTRQYLTDVPPYFTTEAMQLIVRLGIRHLLVDLPSVDRLFDEGRLSNHRIFWSIDQGSFEQGKISRRPCTVTELIYVPNGIADGRYLLNLQIAPFASDASPSRPILFRIEQN